MLSPHGLVNNTVHTSDNMASNGAMIIEYVIRKNGRKIFMVQTDVLSQHYPGHTVEYHKKYEHVESLYWIKPACFDQIVFTFCE